MSDIETTDNVEVTEINMRDSISAAYDEITAKDEPAEVAEAEDAPVTEEVAAPEIQDSEQVKEEVDETPVTAGAIQAPNSWSADDKAKFATLPPDMQQLIAKRESERDKFLTQKSHEFSQQLNKYNEVDHALSPVKQLLEREGLSEAQAVKQLVAYFQHAESNPVDYIRTVAQSYGVDLQKLAAGQYDPRDLALQNTSQRVQTLEQELNDWKKEREQAQTTQLNSMVDDFAKEPGREHFDAVRGVMGNLIATGQAKDLADAYEKAIWANPETRAAELKKQEEQRLKQDAEKVKKAKRAAGPKLGSQEISTGKGQKPATMRESIAEEYDRIVGAA